MKNAINAVVAAVLSAVMVIGVRAAVTPTCEQVCAGTSLPGCTQRDYCWTWTSGCVTCIFDCENTFDVFICPEENPEITCY